MRLQRATDADLEVLLERCRSDVLTYEPVGCSLDDTSVPGLQRRHWTTTLAGTAAFERAANALRTWQVHKGAGLAIVTDGPLDVGTNVAFSAPLPLGFVDGTCRIVAVVDEPDRFGFAYGTLRVHPERGEESFLVVRDAAGLVHFEVEGVSHPTQRIARLLPTIANGLQDRSVQRYLAAMQRVVSDTT